MHDLIVFFSTLGGIAMFGAMGFIVGPMLAAVFLTLLDIYSEEFKDDLDGTQTLVTVPVPPLPARTGGEGVAPATAPTPAPTPDK